jgi:DNA-nicking Smr family endonuclease
MLFLVTAQSAWRFVMRPRRFKHSLRAKSFADLKALLKSKSINLPDSLQNDIHPHQADKKETGPHSEERIFSEAMEGVVPISRGNYVERMFPIELPEGFINKNRDDDETMSRLRDLVRYGKGFTIADTPEYIEGTGYHVDPEIARYLHRGRYSIQAFVDLHGLLVKEAKEVFERFLKWAVITGKTGVLIVHGRGLSSPSEPVLKKKVVDWLTHGPWRKWIIAYSSARACDGGAGATYVLLRQRPISKKLKTKKKDIGTNR